MACHVRTALPAILCAAALFGLSPPRVLATDLTPGATPGPAATAPQVGVEVKDEPSQDSAAHARPARRDAPAAQDAAHRQNEHQRLPRSGRPLDLSAPPVNHVMTREQVQALTEQPEEDASDEVMVQQGRYQAPVPRGQLRALAWALMHPLEAWRIFTPVTDE